MKTLKTIKKILFLALISMVFNSVLAQPESVEKKFLYRSHTNNGVTTPYRLFIPDNYDSTKHYPVILTLHAFDENGSDNNVQIHLHRIATAWADSANQLLHPCFVISPQAQEPMSWRDANVYANVFSILDSIISNFSIDTNRQYITGLSTGAAATYLTLFRYPNRFAAAVTMDGWNPIQDNSTLKYISIWNVHGQNDTRTKPDSSRKLIEGLEKLGRKPVYTNQKYRKAINLSADALDNQISSHADLIYSEVAGATHGDITWTNYYNNPLLMKWVFNQYRKNTNAIVLTNFKLYNTIEEVDTIKWNSTYSKDSVELWFSPDNGFHWEEITSSEPNSGQYIWNISNKEDCVFGLIKIFLKDSVGNIFGSDISDNFAINNASNGKPYIQLSDNSIIKTSEIKVDSLNLFLQLGDPENSELFLNFLYSTDSGKTYTIFESQIINSDQHYYNKWIRLFELPYSTKSIIKISVSDGEYLSNDSTLWFKNKNGIKPTLIRTSDITNGTDLFYYPNPSDGKFTIFFSTIPIQNAHVQLYSIQGNLIFSETYYNTASASIDFKDNPSGMYMIKVFADGINYEEKILKE